MRSNFCRCSGVSSESTARRVASKIESICGCTFSRTARNSASCRFISESKRLQFRSDFVNAFNRVNFNVPNMVLGAGMGLVNSSQDPRNIQFALKFYF